MFRAHPTFRRRVSACLVASAFVFGCSEPTEGLPDAALTCPAESPSPACIPADEAAALRVAVEDLRARVMPALPAGPFTQTLSAAVAQAGVALDEDQARGFARAIGSIEHSLAEAASLHPTDAAVMAPDLDAVRLVVREARRLLDERAAARAAR